MLRHVTTATHSPFSYAYDPSGAELRRALLLPACTTRRPDLATILLGATAGLTLLAGLARIAVA